jgi:GDP-L-fucose synthase
MMNKNSKIYVAGHKGMVGSAILRKLNAAGYFNLIHRTHAELDLTRQDQVETFFNIEKPEFTFLAAAKVGGIMANSTYPADFILQNLQIQTHVIHAAFKKGVKKLLFLGSSCIYPRQCSQPMKEEYLLTGPLEPTNEAYAVAKIAGIKLCRFLNRQYGADFLSVMPTNLYGPGDNFDLETSHVLPALLRKMHLGKCLEQGNWQTLRADLDARPVDGKDGSASDKAILRTLAEHGISMAGNDKQSLGSNISHITHCSPPVTISIWGSGAPYREFLHVDDMADAVVFMMENIPADKLYRTGISHINVGTGEDIPIKNLAMMIRDIVGFQGEIVYDSGKPDGMPKKLLDVSLIQSYGWRHKTGLEKGIRKVYQWYFDEIQKENQSVQCS